MLCFNIKKYFLNCVHEQATSPDRMESFWSMQRPRRKAGYRLFPYKNVVYIYFLSDHGLATYYLHDHGFLAQHKEVYLFRKTQSPQVFVVFFANYKPQTTNFLPLLFATSLTLPATPPAGQASAYLPRRLAPPLGSGVFQ